MARPKPKYSRSEESRVRKRLRFELAQRGWSHREVARRLGDAGVPVSPSWVGKVLAYDHPQSLTVNELGGLREVFGITPSDVFGEQDHHLVTEANDLLAELTSVREALIDNVQRLETAIGKARNLLTDDPEFPLTATDVVSAYEVALKNLTQLYLDAVEEAYGIDVQAQGSSDGKHRQEA